MTKTLSYTFHEMKVSCTIKPVQSKFCPHLPISDCDLTSECMFVLNYLFNCLKTSIMQLYATLPEKQTTCTTLHPV